MKYNTTTFIEKANKAHYNKYDYSQVKYIDSKTKIKIICQEHGIFEQTPANHIRNNKPRGCPICAKNYKLTTTEFIKRANHIHDNKYNYSKVKYINIKTPIIISCPTHGEFKQKPNNHLNGWGCQKCGGNKKLTTNEFIVKAKRIHGDKYDYSNVEYVNAFTKIKIVCPKHGIFKQKPNGHLSGQNCPTCGALITSNKKIIQAKNNFIEKANRIHNNRYDYSFTKYKNSRSKIKIVCPKHGMFEQKVNSHLNGSGCPNCMTSKGELMIEKFLIEKNIKYVFQKTFDDCINENNRKMKFDFYLPSQNILIEYDGKQHFEPIKYFGGRKAFIIRQQYDKIKNDYAEINKIKLIRISYHDYNNINNILINIIN
jgi:hypothetical protein